MFYEPPINLENNIAKSISTPDMPKAQNELANKLCQNDTLSMTQSLIWVYYQPVLKNTKTTLFMFMIQFQAQKTGLL